MNSKKNICVHLSLFVLFAGTLVAEAVKAPNGFKASLFATRPEINSPTCVTATPDGRVFVGVGPNSSLGKEKDVGKIVCCEDTDKDGKADKFTLFTKVDRPRGLFYNDGKLWVLHPPTLSVFTDTDGDNVADESKVLVSDISTDLTLKRGGDHTTNGFAVGIDGWLYIAVGDFGFYKAKGTDGKVLTNQGGGVLRVRPDGSEMEMFSYGLRNIYDVAIDPLLNVFTRDNTDDGGGWNVRFSHVIGGHSHYGYPKYYHNFHEDMVPCLKDYGGGSGVGALAVYEPETYPGKFGDMVYTADWGTSKVYWHELKPKGSSFEPHQDDFFNVGKVSDMAIDGLGSMYVTAFGASYQYGENRGDVYQLKSKISVEGIGLGNIKNLSNSKLLKLFERKSHTVHQNVQFEILRRGKNSDIVSGLKGIIQNAQLDLINRIAALFTLKQLEGSEGNSFITKLLKDSAIREYAIRALADRLDEMSNVQAEVLARYTKDSNPRVRMQVAIALGRVGSESIYKDLLDMTNDEESLVRHVARKSLERLKPIAECLAYVESETVEKAKGALQVLYNIHQLDVVQGLVGILERTKNTEKKIAVIKTLFRLYHKEEAWDGGWWKTRPFNQGPYYKAVQWEGTMAIELLVKKHIALLPKEKQLELAGDVLRNRVDAKKLDLDLPARLMIDYLPKKSSSISKLKTIATSKEESVEIRVKAFKILQEIRGVDSVRAQIEILGLCKLEGIKEFVPLENEFIYATPVASSNNVQRIFSAYIATKRKKEFQFKETKYSEIALRLMMVGKDSSLTDEAAKWKINDYLKRMEEYKLLYKVIGDLKVESMRKFLKKAKKNKKVSNLAIEALAKLDEKQNVDEKKVADLDYHKLEKELMNLKGDIALGQQLFIRQSCIVCHSVNMSQPEKGPYLGASGAMFNRKDLLESIVKPNANLSQGFQTVNITLKNDETKVGFVVKEVDGEVHLRDITGVTHYFPIDEIKTRVESPVSMMPAGLTNNLTLTEMASMLDYLGSLNNY